MPNKVKDTTLIIDYDTTVTLTDIFHIILAEAYLCMHVHKGHELKRSNFPS